MEMEELQKIQKSILISNSTLGCVSLISCLIVVLLFIFRPYLRDSLFKLIFLLSIAEIINLISYFLSLNFLDDMNKMSGSCLCSVQHFLATYGNLSSLIWTLIICIYLYQLFLNKNRNFNVDKKIYLVIGYIIPLLPSCL